MTIVVANVFVHNGITNIKHLEILLNIYCFKKMSFYNFPAFFETQVALLRGNR